MELPRRKNGRFIQRACPDIHCDGELRLLEGRQYGRVYRVWACDGLTHDADDGALKACPREYRAELRREHIAAIR